MISTNIKYIKEIRKILKIHKFKNYKIVLEPVKKNTGPAILSSSLIQDIPYQQPLIFLSADHLIEENKKFKNEINKKVKYLSNKNIFIFGIKPNTVRSIWLFYFEKKSKFL